MKNGVLGFGFSRSRASALRFLFLCCFVMVTGRGLSAEWQDRPELGPVFAAQKVTGTFVYLDPATGKLVGHDPLRAAKRFIPASTFKIPHTVFALSTKAVESMDEVFPYDGQPVPFKAWEKDMSLQEALEVSNATVYQQVAKRIGAKRMHANMLKICYGNMDIGKDVTRFWLDGPLEISAIEQVRFLAELIENGCGYPRWTIEAMKGGLETAEGAGWKMYAKTGWQNAPQAGVGWWVGWVEKDSKIYPFALNIDVKSMTDAKKRKVIGRECLKLVGLVSAGKSAN